MRQNLLIVSAIVAAVVISGGTATATELLITAPKAVVASSVDTAGFPTGGTNPGIFTDTCLRTTTAPNDPILMPGMTGKSMQHDFYGNTHPSASITPAALVGGTTTCTTTADASSYWTPVLYQNGKAMEPRATLIYWRAPSTTASAVQAMPAGITMIAGNEDADSPQSPTVIGWTCSGQNNGRPASEPRDCATGYVRLVATFPNCWDGHTLDGHTQKNVVYATATGCPAAFPVQIPQVVVHVSYPTQSAASLTLSVGPTEQGSILTGHADFMDGWNQSVMASDTAACVSAQTRCGPVSGPAATPKGGQLRL